MSVVGPDCYLILYNVSKKHNVGTIARCATAFNVKEVCVGGQDCAWGAVMLRWGPAAQTVLEHPSVTGGRLKKPCSVARNPRLAAQICLVGARKFNTFGSHGSDAYVAFSHYDTLESCCEDLRVRRGARIIGIEIVESALPIQTYPFAGTTAFMLGNEVGREGVGGRGGGGEEGRPGRDICSLCRCACELAGVLSRPRALFCCAFESRGTSMCRACFCVTCGWCGGWMWRHVVKLHPSTFVEAGPGPERASDPEL